MGAIVAMGFWNMDALTELPAPVIDASVDAPDDFHDGSGESIESVLATHPPNVTLTAEDRRLLLAYLLQL